MQVSIFHNPYIADPSDQGNELRCELQWSKFGAKWEKCIYKELKILKCWSWPGLALEMRDHVNDESTSTQEASKALMDD